MSAVTGSSETTLQEALGAQAQIVSTGDPGNLFNARIARAVTEAGVKLESGAPEGPASLHAGFSCAGAGVKMAGSTFALAEDKAPAPAPAVRPPEPPPTGPAGPGLS